MPTWNDQEKLFGELAEREQDGSFQEWKATLGDCGDWPGPRWWSIYCVTTDAGSDEMKVRDFAN